MMGFEMESQSQIVLSFLYIDLLYLTTFDCSHPCDLVNITDAFTFKVRDEVMQIMQGNRSGE